MYHSKIALPFESSLPQELAKFFSEYAPVPGMGTSPMAWGYKVKQRLDRELWDEIEKYGRWEYDRLTEEWWLITKCLSLEEAQERYGNDVSIEKGPRGGFRGMKVGTATFRYELVSASYREEEKLREQEEEENRLKEFLDEGKPLIKALWQEALELAIQRDSISKEEFDLKEADRIRRLCDAYARYRKPRG